MVVQSGLNHACDDTVFRLLVGHCLPAKDDCMQLRTLAVRIYFRCHREFGTPCNIL